MRRRTKIVATLGPATDDPSVLKRVIAAGVDVVRLNFSHGSVDAHQRRAAATRAIAAELERDVGVLCDLQGPKIRIEGFAGGPVELQEGQRFALDTALPPNGGSATEVGCAYKQLPEDVSSGDRLLLDDGAIALVVNEVRGTRIETTVEVGGRLSDRKGINKQGGGLSAAALTDKDREDLRHAVALGADFIAISFPRNAQDMNEARRLVEEASGDAMLVAKIERAEALPNLDEIIAASDAVMVARGDLGVEIGDAELPGWQKRIIAAAREQNRVVITATQMMESMIENAAPTRAEVLDVANAVMDGTVIERGRHPQKVVEAMARVCVGAERTMPTGRSRQRIDQHFERTDEAIAMATTWTAWHMHADAIIALTESGATAMMMSRSGVRIPIFALTPRERTRERMTLCGGVYPVPFHPSSQDMLAQVREAIHLLTERGLLEAGQRVLLTRGDTTAPGGTNTMKILTVGQV